MSHYKHQQAPGVYPPPPTSYPAPQQVQQGPYVAPPPVGYPMKNGPGYNPENQPPPPSQTKQRGGCCRGCCAGLCCYCLLDACF